MSVRIILFLLFIIIIFHFFSFFILASSATSSPQQNCIVFALLLVQHQSFILHSILGRQYAPTNALVNPHFYDLGTVQTIWSMYKHFRFLKRSGNTLYKLNLFGHNLTLTRTHGQDLKTSYTWHSDFKHSSMVSDL